MNPCNNCYLDDHECHESGFADAKCEAWQKWKTELLIFKANERIRIEKLHKKNTDARTASTEAALRLNTKGIREIMATSKEIKTKFPLLIKSRKTKTN